MFKTVSKTVTSVMTAWVKSLVMVGLTYIILGGTVFTDIEIGIHG